MQGDNQPKKIYSNACMIFHIHVSKDLSSRKDYGVPKDFLKLKISQTVLTEEWVLFIKMMASYSGD